MRGASRMALMGALVAGAGASIASALGAASQPSGRIFGYENIKRMTRQWGRSRKVGNSIATGNRWGGPHLHEREISRRLRQAARVREARMDRGGISFSREGLGQTRRGRTVEV